MFIECLHCAKCFTQIMSLILIKTEGDRQYNYHLYRINKKTESWGVEYAQSHFATQKWRQISKPARLASNYIPLTIMLKASSEMEYKQQKKKINGQNISLGKISHITKFMIIKCTTCLGEKTYQVALTLCLLWIRYCSNCSCGLSH